MNTQPDDLRNRSSINIVSTLLTCTAVLLLAFALLVKADNGRLGNRFAQLNRSIQPLYLLNGFKLPLSYGLAPVIGNMRDRLNGRQLLLSTSDTCQFCEKMLPKWTQMISTLQFQPGDGVIVVSAGDRLARDLEAAAQRRGAELRSLRVEDMPLWVHKSGLTVTPLTVVLDHEQRVRLFPTRLDDAAVSAIHQYFAAER